MNDNKNRIRRRENPEVLRNRIITYLKEYINEYGFSPSVREISKGADIKSTSTVHANLKKMHELGMIIYSEGKRRAISLPNEVYSANDMSTLNNLDSFIYDEDKADLIPLLGSITAGKPIFAYEDVEDIFKLPQRFLSREYKDFKNFLLRIKGDSMIDAAILDGDLVLIESRNIAEVGEIVAAMIGDQATVKRLGIENGNYMLYPENEYYSPIPFNSDDCYIIGVVKAVFRLNL